VGAVRLAWTIGFEDGVAHYRIEKCVDSRWAAIGTVLADGSGSYAFADEASAAVEDGVGGASMRRAAYRIVVVDLTGVEQAFAVQDSPAQWTDCIRLQAGWNLISIPCRIADSALAELKTAVLGPMWSWRGGRAVVVDRPAPLAGLWAFAESARQVMITGTAPETSEVTLEPGWNLVGPAANCLVPAGITRIFTWDKAYQHVLDGTYPGLIRTRGYWVWSDELRTVRLP
jgi:hypothetical protein